MEKNYELWERAIRIALKAKDNLGFIEGILKQPEEVKDHEFFEVDTWDVADSMICLRFLTIIDRKLCSVWHT